MLCFVSSFHTRAWGWGGLGSGVHRSHKRVKATLTDCVPRALVWLQAFPTDPHPHPHPEALPEGRCGPIPPPHTGDQTPGPQSGHGKHPGPTAGRRPDAPGERGTISQDALLVPFKTKAPATAHPAVRPPRTPRPTHLGYAALPSLCRPSRCPSGCEPCAVGTTSYALDQDPAHCQPPWGRLAGPRGDRDSSAGVCISNRVSFIRRLTKAAVKAAGCSVKRSARSPFA